mmetsp:Transcript_3270/g.7277  ORF Transcript_3270/g.7277 Transcript_3270/m.7277 type:complete len:370 (-) Transcript_3270:703-1812(-)
MEQVDPLLTGCIFPRFISRPKKLTPQPRSRSLKFHAIRSHLVNVPGDILRHLRLLRPRRLVAHPLRQRQPPHGVHRRQEKHRRRPRGLLLRRARLRVDRPLVHLPHGRLGEGDRNRDGRSGRAGDPAEQRQLRLPLFALPVVLLHPSGDSEYHALYRGGNRGNVVVLPRRRDVLLLFGDDGKPVPRADHLVRVHLLREPPRGDPPIAQVPGAIGEEQRQRDVDLHRRVHPGLSREHPRVLQQVGVRLRRPLRIQLPRGGEERLHPLQEPRMGGDHRRRSHRERLLLPQPLRRPDLRGHRPRLRREQSRWPFPRLSQSGIDRRHVRGTGIRGGFGAGEHFDEHHRERGECRDCVFRGGSRGIRGESPRAQ